MNYYSASSLLFYLLLARECEERGISVTLAGIFGSGLLWGTETLRYAPAQQSDFERRDKWAGVLVVVISLTLSFGF